MSDEIAYLPVTELGARYRAGTLSPVDVTRVALERIARFEPRINAFCARADDASCLRQSEDAAARWRRGQPLGPFDGVPITVKDAVVAKGWPTLRGSRTADPGEIATEDAPAVARLREQGAIVLGKTTTPEFGWKGVTDSPLSGITRNPWNLKRTPGGSSGGSAAAIAAGIGHAAIGTDGGGSLRIPCAFTGLVAIKATAGRVPNYPASAVGSLGHIGPMTRTVADAALMLDAIGQPDARDGWCLPRAAAPFADAIEGGVRGLRIAFSPTLGYAAVDPEVAEIVARAVAEFAEMGARVETVEAPFPDPSDCFRAHFFVGIAHSCRSFGPEQLAVMDKGLVRVLKAARRFKLHDFMAAMDFRASLARTMRQFHERHDLLLTPTLAVPAFTAGRLAPKGYDQRDWLNWTPFTYPFNLTGQPAATVPCGFTRSGLPVGLQIVGALHDDGTVLRAAHAYQKSHPTLQRRPRL
ncbi:MAG: amidase [Alphaproteobacteria bacterium]